MPAGGSGRPQPARRGPVADCGNICGRQKSEVREPLEAVLSIVGWLMIVATVLPLLRSEYWVVRVFDFPRLQITVVFGVTFAAYLWVREDPSTANNLFLGMLAACLA